MKIKLIKTVILYKSFFLQKNLKMINIGEEPLEEINGVKIEHHDGNSGCKLQQSSNVISWILTEIQKKQEDYVTIICKVEDQDR